LSRVLPSRSCERDLFVAVAVDDDVVVAIPWRSDSFSWDCGQVDSVDGEGCAVCFVGVLFVLSQV